MTTVELPQVRPSTPASTTRELDVDVVIPVYNEERGLECSVRRLHEHLDRTFPLTWQITIVDNASTDVTWPLARRLARELPGVRAVRVPAKGRGRALRAGWGTSQATVLAYMDVDLSTDLRALLPLVAAVLSGHSDAAIGTRLGRGARVERGPKREIISRIYNTLVRITLRARFTDAQCGFKAIRRDRAELLVPLVRDEEWFFDTELLVLAERAGMRIHEVPVDWVDDPDSRVDIMATAIADLKGIVRLLADLRWRPLPFTGRSQDGLRLGSARTSSMLRAAASDEDTHDQEHHCGRRGQVAGGGRRAEHP